MLGLRFLLKRCFFVYIVLIALSTTYLMQSGVMLGTPAAPRVIVVDGDNYDALIRQAVQEPFLLETIDFTTDIFMEEEEFTYLTELYPDTHVDATLLIRAVSYLFKKNMFSTITLEIIPASQGKHLHVALQGRWSLAALKLHGIMVGKDKYRQYYLLEPGEIFDEQKHLASIKKIKEVLAEEGYWAHSLRSELSHDPVTKSVTVHLTFHPGKLFSIGRVEVKLSPKKPECEVIKEYAYEKFLKKLSKQSYSKATLNKEVRRFKRYLAGQGFLHVAIELEEKIDQAHAKVDLTFTLDIHDKKKLLFIGNDFFSDEQLLDELLLFGHSLWMLPSLIMQQEIEQIYAKRGFWQCTVTVQEQADAYTFTINEGNRSLVKKVTLHNREYGDEQFLIEEFFTEYMQLKEQSEHALSKIIENLIAWYVGQGFLQAHLVKQELVPITDSTYELVVTLHEGQRSFLDTIVIPGFEHLQEYGPFLACKQSVEPIPFTMDLVQEQRRWLLDYCAQQGYIQSNITSDIERVGDKVRLVWHIHEGVMRPYFGKTIIQGNSTLPFQKVMRELQYRPGELWDQAKLKDTMLQLKKREIFDGITMHADDNNVADRERAVVLRLLKDDPFEMRVRAGFAAQQVDKSLHTAGLTYRLGGLFLVKNPFNLADQLRIDAMVDRSQYSLSCEYCSPWFMDIPVQTTLKGYGNKYQQPGLIGCKKNLYEIIQQGFLVGLLRSYHENITASVTLGMEMMETTLKEDDMSLSRVMAGELARAINFEPQLLNKKIPYIQIEPTLLLDYIDQALQPYKGSFTLLSCKGMIPLNRIGAPTYLIRCTLEQSYFIPWRLVVIGLRLRLGHVFHREIRNIMPTERFYLGGANSVRSYETDRCPPLGIFIDEKECPQFVPQGGKTMVNGNIEIRFPLPFIKSLGGVAFQDFGFLSGDHIFEWLDRPMVAATGFGLRYTTPLGPLRFDIAWKWHRSYKEELGYAWFISFGQAF